MTTKKANSDVAQLVKDLRNKCADDQELAQKISFRLGRSVTVDELKPLLDKPEFE